MSSSPQLKMPETLEELRAFEKAVRYCWEIHARTEQRPPWDEDWWDIWLYLGGRGTGKTRSGAEAVREQICTVGQRVRDAGEEYIVHLCGPTAADARDVMIKGESGLLNVFPKEQRPEYLSSQRRVNFHNGAYALLFSADEPERLRGPQCLVGETMVSMADGSLRRIDEVQAGDKVLTRKGPRRVLASRLMRQGAETFRLTSSGGRAILGTGEHPVWVENEGFLPMKDVKKGARLCVISASCSRGRGTITRGTDTTSRLSGSIEKFGKMLKDLFLLDTTSTTSMGTKRTTGSRIWSCSPPLSTLRDMPKRNWTRTGPWLLRGLWRLVQEVGRRGEGLLDAAYAGVSTPALQGCHLGTALSSAWIRQGAAASRERAVGAPGAMRATRPQEESRSTAQSDATPLLLQAGQRHSSTDVSRVSGAESNLRVKGSMPRSAQGPVLCLFTRETVSVEKLKTRHDVYDIEVAGEHEFFANGILVHNCHLLWADEIASWRRPDAWDMARFGNRLGKHMNVHPRSIVTGTPKPCKLVRELVRDSQEGEGKDKNVYITRGSMLRNRDNLSDAFIRAIMKKYEGTRLGQQEIYAKVLDDNPNAMWKVSTLDKYRYDGTIKDLKIERIIVSVDPAAKGDKDSDDIGIVVLAFLRDERVAVLADETVAGPPEVWAKKVVDTFDKFGAQYVLYESNQGGKMVESTIQAVRKNIPMQDVFAVDNKHVRAEPVSMLYEQGRVFHVGILAELEAEMTQWDHKQDQYSPNRLDAMVHGVVKLMEYGGPAICGGANVKPR